MQWTYLLVDFFTILIPFIFSFHPRIRFHQYFKEYFLANVATAMVFLVWDALYTHWGVWGFNEKYVLGIRPFGLPIEEILFFFCIPFACTFTYYCIDKFFRITWNPVFNKIVFSLLPLFFLTIGILYIDKAYTAMTCLSTALILLMLVFYWKVSWIETAMTTYTGLLIPFFIVNGILTGTGLDEPVVIYNNAENLGIRLLTIPIEIAYGLELFLLVVFLFEKQRFRNT